jgi:hypothetical protein
MATQRIDRSTHEMLDDEFIEPRCENRETELATLQVAFDGFDVHRRLGYWVLGSGLLARSSETVYPERVGGLATD